MYNFAVKSERWQVLETNDLSWTSSFVIFIDIVVLVCKDLGVLFKYVRNKDLNSSGRTTDHYVNLHYLLFYDLIKNTVWLSSRHHCLAFLC